MSADMEYNSIGTSIMGVSQFRGGTVVYKQYHTGGCAVALNTITGVMIFGCDRITPVTIFSTKAFPLV